MYKSLQGCRAIAAMLVLLFHLGAVFSLDKYFGMIAFSYPFGYGDAGVEFFFVLSGFIIFFAHDRDISRPDRLPAYLKKRAIRIYPAYWIVFFSLCCLLYASPAYRGEAPDSIGLLLKAASLMPLDKLVVGGTGAPVLAVAWTLQYEVLFYVFFGLMIISRYLGMALGLAFAVFYLSRHGSVSLPFPLSFLIQDYVWLFAMGMMVAMICRSMRVSRRPAQMLAAAGLALFLGVGWDTTLGTQMLKPPAVILFGIASSLIVFGLVQAEDSGWVLFGSRWMQRLGSASYALYLVHFSLISIAAKFFLMLHFHKMGVAAAVLAYLLTIGFCVAVAVAFNIGLETPIMERLKGARGLRHKAV